MNHKKGLKRKDGPFIRNLDSVLASFNVQRQAYYSGAFVGNHVHQALKVIHSTELPIVISFLSGGQY